MGGKDTDINRQGRGDRLIKERVHDPYMSQAKLPEPTVCSECGAVYHDGRWQWAATTPANVNEELCPACRRIQEKVPAGFLTLSGGFFDNHRDDIMNLVHNNVEDQKAQHPVKRIMDIEDRDGGGVVITFTDTHLPSGVGKAIERAYEGELDIHYTEEADIVRVTWTRQ